MVTYPTEIPPLREAFVVSGSGWKINLAGPLLNPPSRFETLTFIVYESAPFEHAEMLTAKKKYGKKYLTKNFMLNSKVITMSISRPRILNNEPTK